MASQHPGSFALHWWQQATKDQDGYGKLSELVQVLEEETEVRGIPFLKHMESSKWKEEYKWFLELHAWKPNKVKITESRGGEKHE